MREKIKELAARAGYHPDVFELCKPGMEKFGELIIQECIITLEEVKTFPVTTYERDMTDAETVNKCIKALKDKFQ